MASFTVDNGACQGVARLGLHVLVGDVVKLYANSSSDSELPSLYWLPFQLIPYLWLCLYYTSIDITFDRYGPVCFSYDTPWVLNRY